MNSRGSSYQSLWAAEPFRLFFPLGALWGAAGVALWPLFYAGGLGYFPGMAHSRLMVEGFAGCFILGFLLTAGPRLLSVAGPGRVFLRTLAGLSGAAGLAHLANRTALGDLLFAASLFGLIGWVVRAFSKRGDMPPPGFVLGGAGIACGAAGSLMLGLFGYGVLGGEAFATGKILLFQGFTLLPLMGVGAFFFPKITGGKNRHNLDENRMPTTAWKRRAGIAFFALSVFLGSIAMELMGAISLAYGVRAALFVVYIIWETPLREAGRWKLPQSRLLTAVLAMLVLAFLGAMAMPGLRVAWMHAFFVAGLSGLIFMVSIRVVFGHAGRPDLVKRSSGPVAIGIALLALAGATRLWADVMPKLQASHYIYAASVWLVCVLGWFVWVAPKTRLTDCSEGGSC